MNVVYPQLTPTLILVKSQAIADGPETMIKKTVNQLRMFKFHNSKALNQKKYFFDRQKCGILWILNRRVGSDSSSNILNEIKDESYYFLKPGNPDCPLVYKYVPERRIQILHIFNGYSRVPESLLSDPPSHISTNFYWITSLFYVTYYLKERLDRVPLR